MNISFYLVHREYPKDKLTDGYTIYGLVMKIEQGNNTYEFTICWSQDKEKLNNAKYKLDLIFSKLIGRLPKGD